MVLDFFFILLIEPIYFQIDNDLQSDNTEKLLNQEVDIDKPGGAQHYCIHCARYFINQQALEEHFRTKVHKRRLKALELEPYTIEESERAAGIGNWKTPAKRKIETQSSVCVSENSENSSCKKMKIDEDQ